MLRWWAPYVVVYLVGVFSGAIPAYAQPRMTAHFIDVGQADATLLEFSCGAMLIDAGSQDDAHTTALKNYLVEFFDRRSDLNRTLELILITHNHIDHTRALREVVEDFTVRRFIDSGHDSGTGTGDPNWVRRNAQARNIELRQIADTEVVAAGPGGLTGPIIDPLACEGQDPRIRVLFGRHDANPGWPKRVFRNKNNHSLVTRVDFGSSSFLFTGDLEERAIKLLVDRYDQTDLLDVDIYQVGHHGSHNASNSDLLTALSPAIAVISAGRWSFGKDTNQIFSTFHYGHPRKTVVDMLQDSVDRRRSTPVFAKVALAPRRYVLTRIRKAVYSTAWSGTIRVRAGADGSYQVMRAGSRKRKTGQ